MIGLYKRFLVYLSVAFIIGYSVLGLCEAKHMKKHNDAHSGKVIETEEAAPALPVVCFQDERDKLRAMIVDWLEGVSKKRGSKHKRRGGGPHSKRAYHHELRRQFSGCDVDASGRITSDEFLACMEQRDDSPSDVGIARPGHAVDVLRGLCIDAMIDLSDMNQDWQLDWREFRHLMNPHFIPPTRKCSLEDQHYDDGAETQVDCNTCVCACGHWVCTAATCEQQPASTLPPHRLHYTVKERTDLERNILDSSEWDELIRKFKAFTKDGVNGQSDYSSGDAGKGGKAKFRRAHRGKERGVKMSRSHRSHQKHLKNAKKHKHHKQHHHKKHGAELEKYIE